MDVSIFRKGIPSTALKSKWRNMLLILQKIITCEGRFGTMYDYHIRLLMNSLEDGEINLPLFLLNSLKRMASNVQKRVQILETTLHHHGLVKILIEFHLNNIGDNWEDFLVRNHFKNRQKHHLWKEMLGEVEERKMAWLLKTSLTRHHRKKMKK